MDAPFLFLKGQCKHGGKANHLVSAWASKNGMALAIGDYDNDSDLDFYFSTMKDPMHLLQNQGDGTFSNVSKEAGVGGSSAVLVGWGTAFFDYDMGPPRWIISIRVQ